MRAITGSSANPTPDSHSERTDNRGATPLRVRKTESVFQNTPILNRSTPSNRDNDWSYWKSLDCPFTEGEIERILAVKPEDWINLPNHSNSSRY